MLAAQSVACHLMTMECAHKAALARGELAAMYSRQFAKLSRTFATQIDALQKLRNKGHQRITVERVVVNDGGQAVVGQVGIAGAGQG